MALLEAGLAGLQQEEWADWLCIHVSYEELTGCKNYSATVPQCGHTNNIPKFALIQTGT